MEFHLSLGKLSTEITLVHCICVGRSVSPLDGGYQCNIFMLSEPLQHIITYIGTFSERTERHTLCSIYLLASSICNAFLCRSIVSAVQHNTNICEFKAILMRDGLILGAFSLLLGNQSQSAGRACRA